VGGELLRGVIETVVTGVFGDSRAVVAAGQLVGGTLAASLVLPYVAAVVALVHLDLRVRKEGLDLRGLARELDPAGVAAADPFAPAGIPAAAPGPEGDPAPTGPVPAPSGWLAPEQARTRAGEQRRGEG
jgi:hypothetical protein